MDVASVAIGLVATSPSVSANGDRVLPLVVGERGGDPSAHPHPRELGLAVRRARTDHGWTQEELAARARVGRQWISELEGGKPTAEVGRVLAVRHVLGLAMTFVDAPTASGPVGLDADAVIRRGVDLGERLGPALADVAGDPVIEAIGSDLPARLIETATRRAASCTALLS